MSSSFRRLPFLALLLLLVSFVFNYAGFSELRSRGDDSGWITSSAPAGEEFFQAVRLVLSVQDFREMKEVPPALSVGRWLSFAGVTLFGVLAGWYILRDAAREFALRGLFGRRLKPAMVVIQPPDELTHVVEELVAWHRWYRPVVVLFNDARSSQARVFQRAGLWVVEADDTEEDRLGRCGVELAGRIIIFGSDSAANLAAAMECQQRSRGLAYEDAIHVQIEDLDLQHALIPVVPGAAAAARSDAPPLHPFSIASTKVRQALGPLALAFLPDDKPAVPVLHGDAAYILCGARNWIEAAFREILKLSVVSTQSRPVIHVVHHEAGRIEKRLRTLLPEWNTLHAEVRFHEAAGDDSTEMLAALAAQNWCERNGRPLNFFCMEDEDSKNLALASMLSTWLVNESDCAVSARILYRVRGSRRLAECAVIDSGGAAPKLLAMPQPQEPLLEGIFRERQTKQAAAIHGSYVKLTLKDVELHGRGAAMLRAFHALPLGKREQNLTQAAHLHIKLALLKRAFDKQTVSTAEELKQMLPPGQPDPGSPWPPQGWPPVWAELSELEHLRWKNVQILAGYRAGAARNEAGRVHDCIRPIFEQETGRAVVRYDVGALLLLPDLVEAV